MMHRLFLVTGIGLLAIGSALADVVNVTVNGSLSGSGSVTTLCLTPECDAIFDNGQFATFPFSFSATNITQLGMVAASGGASSPGPPETNIASIQANVSENTTAAADALEITLSENALAGDVAEFADFNLNASVAVTFNLTEESNIQLTDNVVSEMFANSVELLDSKGNQILVVPCDFTCPTVSTVLLPGTYQLDDQMGNSGDTRAGDTDEFFSADLNASFTPVVPEPRWTIIATLLAALLGGYVIWRRETVKRGGGSV